MWIIWVHGRYVQGKGWEDYTPKGDTSWYWKKLYKVKDLFKDYPKDDYEVKKGVSMDTTIASAADPMS